MNSKELKIKECANALFPFAYGVLNSVEDARDISQDVMADFLSSQHEHVKDPKNYLIRSTINRSINLKKRNDKLVHPEHLPEAPHATEAADEALNIEDIATLAFQVLSNALNVNERAIFILKEAFNFSHNEIAAVLSISSDNSRKIMSRAKNKLRSGTLDVPQQHDAATLACLRSFIAAIKDRDMPELKKLLEAA